MSLAIANVKTSKTGKAPVILTCIKSRHNIPCTQKSSTLKGMTNNLCLWSLTKGEFQLAFPPTLYFDSIRPIRQVLSSFLFNQDSYFSKGELIKKNLVHLDVLKVKMLVPQPALLLKSHKIIVSDNGSRDCKVQATVKLKPDM